MGIVDTLVDTVPHVLGKAAKSNGETGVTVRRESR